MQQLGATACRAQWLSSSCIHVFLRPNVLYPPLPTFSAGTVHLEGWAKQQGLHRMLLTAFFAAMAPMGVALSFMATSDAIAVGAVAAAAAVSLQEALLRSAGCSALRALTYSILLVALLVATLVRRDLESFTSIACATTGVAGGCFQVPAASVPAASLRTRSPAAQLLLMQRCRRMHGWEPCRQQTAALHAVTQPAAAVVSVRRSDGVGVHLDCA